MSPGTTGPILPPASLDMARGHEAKGEWDAAEAAYRDILEASPDHWQAMELLGLLLIRVRRQDEALALFDNALAIAPNSHWIHNNRGCILEDLGRPSDAIRSYRAAALLQPAATGPADNLRRLLIQQERLVMGAGQTRPGHPRVLAITLAPDWWSVARMASQLSAAGFDVATFCPRGSHLAQTDHACEHHFLRDENLAAELVDALVAWNPRLILPGDEFAVHLLHFLARRNLPPTLRQVIRDSCGDPRFHDVVCDKTRTLEDAGKLGIRHPAQAPAADLEGFTAVQGYPVVIKMPVGMAGLTVRVCPDPRSAAAAIAELASCTLPPFVPQGPLMVQQHVRGHPASFAFVALDGRMLDGFAYRPRQTIGEGGPASVVERIHHAEIEQVTRRLVSHFGFTGFGGFDFMLDAESGAPYLLEMNPRLTIAGPLGEAFGHDLVRALHAAVTGADAPPVTGGQDVVAVFPHEWWRSADSPHLRRHFTDIPWADASLLRHALATPKPGT